jgi:chromosome segregation ATPase
MAEHVTRLRDTDVKARVTVLETQMLGVAHSVEKIEQKMEGQYQTLHSRISDLRDDINMIVETKNDKILTKLDTQAEESTKQHKALSERLSDLEKWRWMLIGGALVIGYILAHLKLERLF